MCVCVCVYTGMVPIATFSSVLTFAICVEKEATVSTFVIKRNVDAVSSRGTQARYMCVHDHVCTTGHICILVLYMCVS